MTVQEISSATLCAFLVGAKRQTFAADAPRMPSKSPRSKNYLFEQGLFRYEDQYFGEIVDVGMETVWYGEVPIWGMSYRGGVHPGHAEEKETYFEFLREALRSPVPDFPTRGPARHERGTLAYINEVEGDLGGFHGFEQVLSAGIPVCHRRYVGGFILGKHNPQMRLEK